MHKRLKRVWTKLGCQVVDRLGASRHIKKDGNVIVSGGYQKELEYLRVMFPEVLNNET